MSRPRSIAALGMVAAAMCLGFFGAACGRSPGGAVDSQTASRVDTAASGQATEASALLVPPPGGDSSVALRFRAACLDADSALRLGRPFLALVILEKLEGSGLPDTDRAMVWVNIGLVRGKIGAGSAALEAYDRAIALEKPLHRHFALVLKAVFLHDNKQASESAAIFQDLLKRRDISPEEREAFQENLKIIESENARN